MNTFGTALKTMRAELGLSQLDLAGEIGTTQRHVSFLETGRSQPSVEFVGRLATGLELSLTQRAALFDAVSGRNPYRRADFDSDQVKAVLDMLELRALRHWPFPGYVMDHDWTILRANAPGWAMLEGFAASSNAPVSMYEVFLSEAFFSRVQNWEEVAMIFYFRMQAAAARSERMAVLFAKARAEGRFAGVAERLTGGAEVPPYIPAVLSGPEGVQLQMSSLVGQLASTHEAAIEGLEVELMIPVDETTEACLLAAYGR